MSSWSQMVRLLHHYSSAARRACLRFSKDSGLSRVIEGVEGRVHVA